MKTILERITHAGILTKKKTLNLSSWEDNERAKSRTRWTQCRPTAYWSRWYDAAITWLKARLQALVSI